jgi:SAM-dependent methyltransferase
MEAMTEKSRAVPWTRRSIVNALGRQLVPRSPTRLRFHEFLLLHPLVFGLWFHARRSFWWLRGYRLRRLELGNGFVREKALPYNLSQIGNINRGRTERLMLLMRAIEGFSPKKARMLVVGPRNEAELLLLRGYGFRLENLAAIDLFSYSPAITLMDMHDLKYPDASFDAVYSSFVITYSDDIPKAIKETVRVARHGALIIFAFQHLRAGTDNALGVNRLEGGARELLELFGEHVGHVYWSEDHEYADGSRVCSTMFRLKKRA